MHKRDGQIVNIENERDRKCKNEPRKVDQIENINARIIRWNKKG